MSRRHIWHNGEWVDVTDWKRPPRKTPYLIRDTMDAARHPATGEVIDSKSAFRAVTRAHGMQELGNDAPDIGARPDTVSKDDVARAYDMVAQGYAPPPNETVSPDAVIYS